MPERRSSRSLREVSHLFLSESRPARSEARSAAACVWLAVADPSLNRAYCAAGLAAAFARHGVSVSLLEVSVNLPTVGYYFGMERSEYLAPALDRAALLSGSWNGAVRYCFSASVSALRQCSDVGADRASTRAIIAAFQYPFRRDAASFLAALGNVSAAWAGGAAPGAHEPDAVIIGGGIGGAGPIGNCAAGIREAFPRAAGFIIADRAVRAAGTFERIPLAETMRRSWARRMPPADPWFDDLASGLLQVVSLQRRGAARRASGR